MSQAPDNHELARQLEVLRGEVNTTSAKLEGEMSVLKSDLKATLEGFRKDQANMRISMMVWTAAMAGLIIAVVTGFNLYEGPPAAP